MCMMKKNSKEWRKRWCNIGNNKLREIQLSVGPIIYPPCTNRAWEVKLTRLRIGHCRLTHGHLIAAAPQVYCQDCVMPFTVKHVLSECPNYCNERRPFFSSETPSMEDIFNRYLFFNNSLYKFL